MSSDPVPVAALYDASNDGKSLIAAANFAAMRTLLSVYDTATIDTALGGKVDSSSLSESIDDRVAALLVAGTNITITYNDASGTLTVASTAGGLSGTGSVDNAALRADGTGGATLQNSAWIINDNLTASPNNTVNHACLEATGGTTNVSVSVKPKGTGAFSLAAPDGTTTGGNVRGANAVDLQTLRNGATKIASGTGAFIGAGAHNTASGNYSVVFGTNNIVSGANSVAFGDYVTVSGVRALAVGTSQTVSGNDCGSIGYVLHVTANHVFATGSRARADRLGMRAHGAFSWTNPTGGSGSDAGSGGAQYVRFVLGIKTTDATPATVTLDGASSRLTVRTGTILFADVLVSGIKSDGSVAACYKRKVAIKNVGGTTSLVGSVETIGTDIEDNASTDLSITADNTNDALQISVTGIASETWRWVAVVEGLEIIYGT